jgi:Protein of unknown function (DUF1207)
MSSIRVALVLLGAGLLVSLPAAAQDRFFPAVRSFELPGASPRVHGFVGRVLSVKRGDSRFGKESEGEVVLGENFPVIALKRGVHPIILGIGSQVYGRFSLTDKKSALISNDWVAGLNTTALLGPWALTLELYHESSHLGDEYGDRFQATRLDWTREVLAAWATYGLSRWRFTGGASYVLDDELRLPRAAASIGVDFSGTGHHLLGGHVRPVLGVFTEAAESNEWRFSTSAKAGVALAGGKDGRELSLALIGHNGLSTQRQFFRNSSRYIGVEVRFDL